MSAIVDSPDLVAYCGLYCGACRAHLKGKCGGCLNNAKATWCQIRSCCIDKRIRTCAECPEFAQPRDCAKFNNVVSRIFALIFRSDREACIAQIKRLGVAGHAKAMTEMKRQSLPRGGGPR